MSRSLKYEDLNAAEQLQYTILLKHIDAAIKRGKNYRENRQEKAPKRDDPALKNQTRTPLGHLTLWASVKGVYSYGKRWFARYRRQPGEQKCFADLEQFIRTQASNRGCETFERASFPHCPDGIEPFTHGGTCDRDQAKHAYPDALHHIIATFREASPAQRLEMLVAYAGSMPELPEELQRARDTMEQVDECQTPVFLLARLRDGTVHSDIDVPRDAPTMRGFAGLLHAGLNGATPAAIAATPNDLCQQLGLHRALAPLRLRGLTALLSRMKRHARDLAQAM